ncbi:hypothetical protein I4U23_006840 [Adineta vaga]|nr:hypothetical protein I4U23_006840 [Adineta vaga]
MKDLLRFVHENEALLKQYGAIKLIAPSELGDVLKTRRITSSSCSTIQRLTPLNRNKHIFSVTTTNQINKESHKQLSTLNEVTFWKILSRSIDEQYMSNVTVTPNSSFFLKNVYQSDFNIYKLPRQSLLKLCPDEILNQFVPCLIRMHGPGAIIPLASARQRLSSFNYHHEGGTRHWYIIPASERKALEDLLEQQQKLDSICLNHGHIFIDPSILNTHKIRYYKIVQQPNEIVILSAGILSQSFSEDANWNESIDFALPSWINDKHATTETSCMCRFHINALPDTIDTKVFDRLSVRRYVRNDLNISTDDLSLSDSDDQTTYPWNLSLLSNISIGSPGEFYINSIESSLSIHGNDEDEYTNSSNRPSPIRISIDGSNLNPSNENMSLHELHRRRILSGSPDMSDHDMSPNNKRPHHLSFEDMFDFIATPFSPYYPADLSSNDDLDSPPHISTNSPAYDNSSNTVAPENFETMTHINRTLYISNMKPDVTKDDIYRHFTGCIKVTIGQSYLPPHLNYAFILHSTESYAEYNRTKPFDHRLFGANCCIEYAKGKMNLAYENPNFDQWSIVVRHIPENVSEESIRNLFSDCEFMKYIPARHRIKRTRTSSVNPNKILWGYV